MEETLGDVMERFGNSKVIAVIESWLAYLPPILMWPTLVPIALGILVAAAGYRSRVWFRALFIPEAFR